MVEPQVQWVSPTSLWQTLASAADAETRAQFRQPQLLRFATDTFMDEFMGLLNSQPERLSEWVAQSETWRDPSATPLPIEKLPPALQRVQRLRLAAAAPLTGSTTALAPSATTMGQGNLKLYQPAHLRYYLVSACLVCRIPGLPDRMLDIGAAERTTFVVRRLRPKGSTLPSDFNLNTCDEYALVNGNQWEKATADAPVPGEEQLPMFGVTYTETDGRKRRVLSSLVPVGKRETYMGATTNAPVLAGDDPPQTVDPRKVVLLRQVTDPWRSMTTQAEKALADFDAPGPAGLDPGDPTEKAAERVKVRKAADDQADLLSWYILLDFGDYLEKYLPDVWAVIAGDADPDTLVGSDAQVALLTRMQNASYTGPGAPTLTLPEALVDVREWRDSLESTTLPYSTADPANLPESPPFPDFRFPLNSTQLKELVAPASASTMTLDDLVNDALQEVAMPASTPPLPLAAQMTTLDGREPGWFVIRCVFERPNCGPLKPVVISEATQPFQMASFFDPDAPARPIRINMPLDTTPAGLRKFDKNTAFVLSDVLACQMERMGNLTLGDLVLSVLPWPLHKDLPSQEGCGESGAMDFGMICSISIPIITICAMIMLMIIVTLLDLVLKWKLFFMLCFPFPRLKAKE